MTKTTYTLLNNYANFGQNVEQSLRFKLTGRLEKADNVPHDKGADCMGYQIKSARATVCKGTDIVAYIRQDKATAYIYGAKNGIAYIMTVEEYIEFITVFGTVTRESSKNGGAEKIRLKSESKALLEYLEARA